MVFNDRFFFYNFFGKSVIPWNDCIFNDYGNYLYIHAILSERDVGY